MLIHLTVIIEVIGFYFEKYLSHLVLGRSFTSRLVGIHFILSLDSLFSVCILEFDSKVTFLALLFLFKIFEET